MLWIDAEPSGNGNGGNGGGNGNGGGGFPDATTTGPAAAGYTTLTPVSLPSGGNVQTSSPWVQAVSGGYLVEGIDFTLGAHLTCNLANTTFRGCRFTTAAGVFFGIDCGGTGPITFEYCQIIGADKGSGRLNIGINADNRATSGGFTVDHCDIAWTRIGVQAYPDNVTITNNFIHDMGLLPPPADDHTEPLCLGNQSTPASGMIVEDNTLLVEYDQTAAIIANSVSDFEVRRNLLGGGGWTVYVDSARPSAVATGVVYEDNEFTTVYWPLSGFHGPASDGVTWGSNGNVWQRNTWHDGPNAGQPVAAPGR